MVNYQHYFQENFMNTQQQAPTKAFRVAAVAALVVGGLSYAIGLFNAEMALNEKGYYLAVILFGLFSAVSVQKSVRDKAEGIPTSTIYHTIAIVAVASAIGLLCIGLYNAELLLSEKGFFGMAYTLSLFAAITVQKNVRDMQALNKSNASQDTVSNREEKVEASQSKAKKTAEKDDLTA
jgi:uncharacterized membrane protein YiaA